MKDEMKTKEQRVKELSIPRRETDGLKKRDGELKRAEEAAQQAMSLLTSTIESTADGILVIDNQGKITILNKKFLSMWRIPESLAAKRDDKILLDHVLSQLKDPEGFIEKVKQLYSQPEAESFDILEFKDGRIFERFSQPQRLGNHITGRVWSFRDVTDRKRAEEEQRRNQETAERLAGEIGVIAEIGRLIGSTLDIEEVYERFAAEAKKLIPFDRLVVNQNKPQEGERRCVYVSGVDIPGRRPGNSKALSGSTDDMLLRTRSGIIVQAASVEEMVARFPGVGTVLYAGAGLRSLLSVPLIYRDEVIGALHFWSKKPEAYTEKDLRLAERIGSQIAGAIASAQLFADLKRAEEKTERRSKQLAALHESSVDLTAELNLNALLQSVAQRALDLIGGRYCYCYLYRPEADLLERVAMAGQKLFPGRTTPRRGEGFVGHIWETGAPLLIDDYNSWPGRDREYDRYPSRALVGVPIHWGEEFLGVISIIALLPHRYT